MTDTDSRIRKVVILGGGTAGWMTAAYLGKALQAPWTSRSWRLPPFPRIGVGEATVPNLHRVLFDYLGIPEEEWMRECNASFKMAVRFVNWRTPRAAVKPTPAPWTAAGPTTSTTRSASCRTTTTRRCRSTGSRTSTRAAPTSRSTTPASASRR